MGRRENLAAVTNLPIGDACDYFGELKLTGRRGEIADKILKEIRELPAVPRQRRSWITCRWIAAPTPCPVVRPSVFVWPARSVPAWLASCTSSTSRRLACTNVNDRLLGTLKHLRDIGNTVIVVEHDEDDSPG